MRFSRLFSRGLRKTRLSIQVAFFCCALINTAVAQINLTGTVSDASGDPIKNVIVTLRSNPVKYADTTAASGTFSIIDNVTANHHQWPAENRTDSPDRFSIVNQTVVLDLHRKTSVALDIIGINGRVIQSFFSGTLDKGTHKINPVLLAVPKGVFFVSAKIGSHKFSQRVLTIGDKAVFLQPPIIGNRENSLGKNSLKTAAIDTLTASKPGFITKKTPIETLEGDHAVTLKSSIETDIFYSAWNKAGLTGGAAPYVNNASLRVHATLTSGGAAALNTAIQAASAASTGGVPEVVEAYGTFYLDSDIIMRDYVILRCPAGEELRLRTSQSLSIMVNFNGGYFQNRSCTITGSFNSYNAEITNPGSELEPGIWQIGSNSSDGPGGQIVEITNINGITVTLAEPLTQDFTNFQMLSMNNGLSDFVTRAGLEGNIILEPLHDVTDLIYARAAYDCWISGVSTDGTTDDGYAGTGAGQLRSAVFLRQSYHVLVHNFTADNARNHGDGGSGYGINLGSIASMILIPIYS